MKLARIRSLKCLLVGPDQRKIFLALAFLATLTTTASGCAIATSPTRKNFAKLIACVNSLQENVKQLEQQIHQMDRASSWVATQRTDTTISREGIGDAYRGTLDLNNKSEVTCPPGSWVSGIQGLKAAYVVDLPSAVWPITELRYSCRSLK